MNLENWLSQLPKLGLAFQVSSDAVTRVKI